MIFSGKLPVVENTSPSNSIGISVGVRIASVAVGVLGDGALAGAMLQAVIESAINKAMIFAIELLLLIGFVFMLHPFFEVR